MKYLITLQLTNPNYFVNELPMYYPAINTSEAVVIKISNMSHNIDIIVIGIYTVSMSCSSLCS